MSNFEDQIDRSAFASIRRRLTLRKKALEEAHDLGAKLAEFREKMDKARERAIHWRLKCDDFDAMSGGLSKTYRRAQKAERRACAEPSEKCLHEWRKRVKYHWYHSRLLHQIWLKPMKAHRQAAGEVSGILGEHHDLAIFRRALATEPAAFGKIADVEVMIGLASRRQATLEAEAGMLGARLLAEPASCLNERWRTYWTIWKNEPARREEVLSL